MPSVANSVWEYNVLAIVPDQGFFSMGGKVDSSAIAQQLNEFGAAGWELVSSFDTNMHQGVTRNLVFIFKRPFRTHE